MSTEIQQVKISQLNTISDWRNSHTIATDRNGQSVKAPLEPVSKIGDLSKLDTTDKSSLVAAINEVATKGAVTVDSALSSTSENPVQNKVITSALNSKQGTITDLDAIRTGANKGSSAYQKPANGIPASDLESGVVPDVSGFVTKSVSDLLNYYLKSETYTKAEVQELIGAINQFHYETYPSTSDVSSPASNVLYLIGPNEAGVYQQYIYTTDWVPIGSTQIDLSTKQDTLVSGTNIKTVNGESILGSGNINAGDVLLGRVIEDNVTINGL